MHGRCTRMNRQPPTQTFISLDRPSNTQLHLLVAEGSARIPATSITAGALMLVVPPGQGSLSVPLPTTHSEMLWLVKSGSTRCHDTRLFFSAVVGFSIGTGVALWARNVGMPIRASPCVHVWV